MENCLIIKVLKIFSFIVLLTISIFAISLKLKGIKLCEILSNSEQPYLNKGDFVVVKNCELNKGDLGVFNYEGITVCHRLIYKDEDYFYFCGDDNRIFESDNNEEVVEKIGYFQNTINELDDGGIAGIQIVKKENVLGKVSFVIKNGIIIYRTSIIVVITNILLNFTYCLISKFKQKSH